MLRKARILLASLTVLAASVAVVPPALAEKSAEAIRMGTFTGAYLAGRVAESDDDLDNAIAYYKQALAFDPSNEALQQAMLLSLIARGRFDESLPYADKLKTVAEVERISRLALAVDSMRKKDYKKAQDWLQLALESDLDRLIVNVIAAWAQVGEGKPQQAIDLLAKLQGPDWYSVFTGYHTALIADAAGMKEKAEEAYSKTLDNVGGGSAAPDAFMRAAEAYSGFLSRSGRKADALAVLDRAETFAVNRLPITVLRGKINKGEPVSPLVSTPQQGASETLLNLGTALNRGGGEPFVRLYLQLALALTPDNDIALMHLAEVAEQQEDAEGAINLYRRVPSNSPFARVAQMQIGLNLADLDKKDEAVAQLKRLLAADPNDMRAYLALGGVYASKEDFRSAANLYDEAAAKLKNPIRTDWNIFYQRGIAYERLKEWPKAEPNFRKALELFPNQPQVMNYLGYSWVDMNRNLEEGLDLIRKAVDLRPSDGYIVDSLGWAYYRLGRFEEAVTELERAVSLKPDDPVLNDHLGDAYWRAGRRLEATFQWSHARDLKPEPDVLASVQKKLAEGMPPLEPKAVETPKPTAPDLQPAPVKKTELIMPAEPVAPATPAKPALVQPAAAPAATATPASYVVQPGQSLWSIAAERLGNGERYIEIIDLNPQLRNPGRLLPGTELILPGS
jgi:tetratricopeptide (TPR) repeat protein